MIQKSYDNTPSLYLIPTPIGNMDDMTIRAINTLKEVDLLFCEDTRVTGQLLNYFNIKKKMISCEDHNESRAKEIALQMLSSGKNIGLVTDRGTPIISDPGYKVVQFVVENGYNVISLPGATAFVPALTMSGITPLPFVFYGFLNSKHAKRIKELQLLKNERGTLIFYEAPHRIKDTMIDILEIFGNRKACLCREISKIYEEAIRGTLEGIISDLDHVKGELVIVVEGNTSAESYDSLTIIEHVNLYLEDGMTEKEAIKKVAIERNLQKSIVYREFHMGKWYYEIDCWFR